MATRPTRKGDLACTFRPTWVAGLMNQFPRVLIPTAFVPLFILLHMLGLARSSEVIAVRRAGRAA